MHNIYKCEVKTALHIEPFLKVSFKSAGTLEEIVNHLLNEVQTLYKIVLKQIQEEKSLRFCIETFSKTSFITFENWFKYKFKDLYNESKLLLLEVVIVAVYIFFVDSIHPTFDIVLNNCFYKMPFEASIKTESTFLQSHARI